MAIIDVIKYDNEPDVLARKYPSEALTAGSQLIVNESQEAVLLKEGQILGVFTSGRYTLDTENIPILNKMMNLPFGGRSPFTAEIWFVNKTLHLDIKWGTASPIQIQDPKYGIFVPVRSNGMFGIRIIDSYIFMSNLVGTAALFDKNNLRKFFRGLCVTTVKEALSMYIVHQQVSLLEINAYIGEISEYVKQQVQPVLQEYGIELTGFYINDISIPEDDSAVITLKEVLSTRAAMNIIGSAQERHVAAGGQNEIVCGHCGTRLLDSVKYCSECGRFLGPVLEKQ